MILLFLVPILFFVLFVTLLYGKTKFEVVPYVLLIAFGLMVVSVMITWEQAYKKGLEDGVKNENICR